MKIIKKTYKFRIYPTNTQKELIEKTLGCVRHVYNYFLAKTIEEYKKDISYKIRKFDLIKLLPKHKEEFPFLKEVDSIALQQSVIHLCDAYGNFFKKNTNFPTFKKKKQDYGYITMNNNNSIRIIGDEIQIPKIGRIKLIKHRDISDTFIFSMVSISRKGKYYHVSLMGEEEYCLSNNRELDISKSIGLDFSLNHLYIDNHYQKGDIPKYFEISLQKLAKMQRKLSKMVKGSNNYLKQKLKIDNFHIHISNQRKDFLHKLSRSLVNEYDYICIEDLDLKAIASKETKYKFGKIIFDLGFSTFINFLSYKLDWENKKLIKIDKFYPSSKTCFLCGYVKEDLKLSDRFWTCPYCGETHERDYNAAINIHMRGMRKVVYND